MAYELILAKESVGGGKDIGENTFLNDLESGFPVYIFYYPSEAPDPVLEASLRSFGGRTGANAYVNIGQLNDPNFDTIAKTFELKKFPVIVVTATSDLAGPPNGQLTSYARLQGALIADAPTAIKTVEEVYLLFLRGDIKRALRIVTAKQITEVAERVTGLLVTALKHIGAYVASRDVSVSVVDGKFEVKKSAG